MATLASLRTIVRRDLHDLPIPNENSVDADEGRTYPFPTDGPILTGSFTLDIDGVTQDPSSYTLYEMGYVVLPAPPSGGVLHATWQRGRWSNEDLNQFIQEAIRELSMVHPKLDTIRHTPVYLTSAKLTVAYAVGDAQFVVDSTSGYADRGVVQFGSVLYFYTSKDNTHFLGLDIWAGPDRAQAIGTVGVQDDNAIHGWFFDPNVIRDVFKLQGYEAADGFGAGQGYQDIAYFTFDPTTGYLHLEFDFSQITSGSSVDVEPLNQFQVFVGRYYTNPVNDSDTLDIPDYALNPISWLAAALAEEAREADRDLDYRENAGNDTTANPVGTFLRAGSANRKKWNDWVAKQFRSTQYPVSRRRRFTL